MAAFSLQFQYLQESCNVLEKKIRLVGQVFLKLLTPKDVHI